MDCKIVRQASLAGLLLALAGCGRYTVVFDPEEIINTDALHPQDDTTREMLAVDIVCLTPADVRQHPEITNRTMRAKEWFAARDQGNAGLAIPGQRIYALRAGTPGPYDTLAGASLLSGRESEQKRIAVAIRHPQPFALESRVAVYGRFHRGNEVARVEPLVFKPPLWERQIVIRVGRTGMFRVARP